MTIPEFIIELAKEEGFSVQIGGTLRRPGNNICEGYQCPITAVHATKTGERLPIDQYGSAAAFIGLSLEDAQEIIRAADGYSVIPKKLRTDMLAALKIQEDTHGYYLRPGNE